MALVKIYNHWYKQVSIVISVQPIQHQWDIVLLSTSWTHLHYKRIAPPMISYLN